MPINKTNVRRDGLQQYRVRVNYTDNNGKYRQIERVAYGNAEAKALEKKLLDELKTPSESRMTVLELYHEYMRSCKPDLRESTWDKKRRMLECMVLPTMGGIRLDRLTLSDVNAWKMMISERGLSTTTAKNYYKEFSALLNYAVRFEYIPKNPLKQVGNFKSPEIIDEREKLRYYTPEQYLRFAEAALENAQNKNILMEWGYYVFFSIAFYTGMRKGEINALRWRDIEGNLIHVRRSVSQKVKGGDRYTGPKNKSSVRDIQIPSPLAVILKDQKERQKKLSQFSDDLLVCGGETALRDENIDHRNRAFSERAGLPRIRIHDFRHTHATVLINEGISIQEIARRLGHAKVEMTWKVYAHLYPREEERAVNILNKIE